MLDLWWRTTVRSWMFCGNDMEIERFDIIDLGVTEREEVAFGRSHQYDGECLGIGDNAGKALGDALTQLSFEGLGTKTIEHVAREMGWFGQSAQVPAGELFDEDFVEDGEDGEQEVVVKPVDPKYHVLIRYEDPRPEEVGA